jgi:hypothetical protein
VRFITNVMLVYARAQQQQIHRAVAGVWALFVGVLVVICFFDFFVATF